MQIRTFISCLIILTVFSGCSSEQKKETQDSNLALLKTTNPAPITTDKNSVTKLSIADQIKQEVSNVPEIYDVAVVKGKKKTLVVYKVRHMQRFNMKKIEKNLKKKLKKSFPEEKITVSSDYKIFLEAVKLKEKMENSNISEKEAEKQLKEIIAMKKEMT